MNRRQDREAIISGIYSYDIMNRDIDEIIESLEYNDIEYIKTSIIGVIDNLTNIDNVIKSNLVNWKIDRISTLDKSILRFGTYEILNKLSPFPVIVNEAIEFSKKYSDLDDKKSSSFINKVLDKIGEFLNGK